MRPGLFDSHAHYNDPRFAELEGGAPALIASLLQGDVSGILNAAVDAQTAEECIALAERFDGVYAAAGVHPSECARLDAQMDAELERICALLRHPKVRAIGEIGLDYHYDDSPRQIQQKWFEAQLDLAQQTGYPVIIHDREAHGQVMDTLAAHPAVRGVMHSFSGSAEMAKELLKRYFYVSFSGTVTFRNAKKLPDAVRAVPLERMLIETDCPYLAPVPMRGKCNHSGYLIYTAQFIAACKDVALEQVIAASEKIARTLFGISP